MKTLYEDYEQVNLWSIGLSTEVLCHVYEVCTHVNVYAKYVFRLFFTTSRLGVSRALNFNYFALRILCRLIIIFLKVYFSNTLVKYK